MEKQDMSLGYCATLKHSAKIVMFALEGKTSDSHCGEL